jgi:hypothetical protein
MSESIPVWATDFDCWMRRQAAAQKARQEAPEYWDDAKIDLVLSKIKRKYWREPLDRTALTRDLDHATRLYAMWQIAVDPKPTRKQVRDWAERIQKLCARLLKELPNPDHSNSDGFLQRMFQGGYDLDVLRSATASLTAMEKLAVQRMAATDFQKTENGFNTANQWLIDRKIPEIYKLHFIKKPRGVSYTRGRQNPFGPALDFALTVVQIMEVTNKQGKPYEAAGIAEIWKRR